MKLKIKALDFSSGGPFVAVLNIKDSNNLDLHPSDRIKIKYGQKELVSVLDITENNKTVKPGEIGLFDEIIKTIGRKKGYVNIHLSERLTSLAYIKKKLGGKKLRKNEINEIIKDIINNNLNEVELTYFVSACYSNKLTLGETLSLTKAIVEKGNRIELKKYPVLDKHCTGGVAGNRTSMIIVPILAAFGLTIPKTSSRAISSASGTSDTMEVLAKVDFSLKRLKYIINKTNACMVWGGGFNIASADDKLIRVRNPLSLDPEGLLLSSIMAKKQAVSATHVLIDIPIGKDTKVETMKTARRLKRNFIKIGKKLRIKVKVIFTDGSQPIGNGIGPALEARDVLKVLNNQGPKDLRDKSVEMAGILLSMVGIKKGKKKALEILKSGQAYKKMKEIIKSQGGNPNITPEKIKVGKYSHIIRTKKSGTIHSINNKEIAKIARMAGSPVDKGAGIYLWVHVRDKVKKGGKLFTLYSENKTRLKYALELHEAKDPITIIR
ncbi:MAG: AMP phosphorylase [Nanoarchaeota archaeon]|nr:AMP phosphorylase [Nanoarchaeota archaeon]